MKRTSWIGGGLLLAAVVAAGLLGLRTAPAGPNLVFIVLDTTRWDHLQSYGYDRPTSPEILALGERGAVFDRAYTHTGWTAPSVASLMTSLPPRDHGLVQWDQPLEAGFLTLAEHLGAQGYQTLAVVSHFVFEPELGFAQGFDSYHRSYDKQGSPHRISSAGRVTSRALGTLDKLDRSRPFFLWAHYFDAHADYLPHPEFDFGEGDLDLYDGELAHTDKQVGRLLRGLEERGLTDNTWIVLVADHGEEFRDHGGLQHTGKLFEELVHLPLIIAGPGIQPQRVESVVRITDIAPTVLALLGLPVPAPFAGEPIALDAAGEFQAQDRPVYLEVLRHGDKRGLVEGDYKLIRDLRRDRVKLFDLAEDPREKRDLSRVQAARTHEMLGRLDAWFATPHHQPAARELSVEEKEALRALGYIE